MSFLSVGNSKKLISMLFIGGKPFLDWCQYLYNHRELDCEWSLRSMRYSHKCREFWETYLAVNFTHVYFSYTRVFCNFA